MTSQPRQHQSMQKLERGYIFQKIGRGSSAQLCLGSHKENVSLKAEQWARMFET